MRYSGYFKFVGANGSNGYLNGRVYKLHLNQHSDGVTIMAPRFCPYDTNTLFYENWELAESNQLLSRLWKYFKRGLLT